MRYQYQSNFFRGSSYRPRLFTDAIKLLVSINLIIFLLQTLSGQERLLFQLFGIVPRATWKQLMIWQPFTYLFFHGGFWHVLINMFVLWMFGSELETTWGKKEFFRYYFLTGVGSGIITVLFNLNALIPVVGASGAVYGILLAYGLMFPNRYIYLYFFLPVQVKYFVVFIGALAFLSSLNPGYSNVAHLTHLSGMVIGFLYLKSTIQLTAVTMLLHNAKGDIKGRYRHRQRDKREKLRLEVDQILDKINASGYDSLTKKQKDFLYEASKKLSEDEDSN
ncbi:MAG: rhomboid family intramembrane serine protease [Candidatus Marinimicrobia bacterium]|jgi:membrane associated rhomboid family serine protease|nr:rhomboid family intramembrane serine protease [Candidatus Neomarinimicrobiota bacterium]MDP6456788.1 rhomboid family intramembrane serine protease [Candidatus Neomarinimicrobiota bacterium]MDP6593873.1 rhomboid family intramembrane serine protease [Candidatus Neomarinimicrobiota bacterium]MDP6835890.1 rhomboid family intramembrane serine protease [Candidatus Neomarinimicrobiota bacterium]MDP6966724.1 rhomboid family intramembrane serine protease [Candidatus Neomarinimicrobiota bacterium]|tara:strand:+ start:500 stop:1333 length:834 start_codon:yes stop_codon:yes gene_type:complete